MPLLIVARALQGIGGGLVMAVALASIGLTYPSDLRPRALAANSTVWGLMAFGGPALAGVVLAVGDWRLIFVVQLPLTGLALLIGWSTLPEAAVGAVRTRFDTVGVALLTVLTLASLVAVSEVGDRWDVVAVGTVVSAVTAAGYWIHAGKSAAPVLARRHIVGFPNWAAHAVVAVALTAGLALDNFLPIYVQVDRGHSESVAAFTLAFLSVGWTSGSILFSRAFVHLVPARVMRWGALLVTIGCALGALSIWQSWHLAGVFACYTIIGLGIGLATTPAMNWLQSSSAPTEMGRATGSHHFLRQLAITYGVAAGGAVLLAVVAQRVDDVDVVREALAGEDVALGGDAGAAIAAGLATVGVMSACLALIGVVVSSLVLRRVTGGVRHRP